MGERPLLARLQVKAGRRLALLNAPKGREALFAGAARASLNEAEVVVSFAATRAEMAARLAKLTAEARKDAILWLAYAKKTSPHFGEIHRDVIHEFTRGVGLDTVAQIALDD